MVQGALHIFKALELLLIGGVELRPAEIHVDPKDWQKPTSTDSKMAIVQTFEFIGLINQPAFKGALTC